MPEWFGLETAAECIGRAVTSKAGRDRGRTFLITGIADEDCVLLSDGGRRPLARPKKKKLKHLRVEAKRADAIAERLTADISVEDREIRAWLEEAGYNSLSFDQEESLERGRH